MQVTVSSPRNQQPQDGHGKEFLMSLLNNLIHYELTWILNVDWKVGDPEPLEIPVTLLSLYPGCGAWRPYLAQVSLCSQGKLTNAESNERLRHTKTHFKRSSLYFRIQDSILGKSSMKEK